MKSRLIDERSGIYSIDASRGPQLVPCYSYLLLEGNSAALIDPGGREDFAAVFSAVTAHTSCEQIGYIILTSETPEAASSLPLWERTGFGGKVVLSWRASLSARHYAPQMDFFTLSGRNESISLGKERILRFIQFPGLPTIGAQVCWDETSRTLFSGKLFGTVRGSGQTGEDLPQKASGSFLGQMASYHELFLPRPPAAQELELLEALDAVRVCPQHSGSIEGPLAELFVFLRQTDHSHHLPAPEIAEETARARTLRQLLQRLRDLFPGSEVDILLGSLTVDLSAQEIGREEYEEFFSGILKNKGYTWLALINTELRQLSSELNLPLPRVYREHAQEIAGGMDTLLKEVRSLRDSNFQLQQSIIQASDDLLRDRTTGLYNESFFSEYVASSLQGENISSDSVLFLRLDEIKSLNSRFGADEVDKTLQALAYFLLNRKRESAVLFRLTGPTFAAYLHGEDKTAALEYAEELKLQVERSDEFIAPLSISAAIVGNSELLESEVPPDRFFTELMKLGKERIKILDRLGPGSICTSSRLSTFHRSSGTVLLIESNDFEARLYRRILEAGGFEVFHARHGTQALARADEVRPDVIISEIFVTHMDGFQIRQRLLASQDLKEIPFILLSREKSDISVRRGFEMRIYRHFRKPVMPAELTGAVQALIERRDRTG